MSTNTVNWFTPITYDEVSKCSRTRAEIEAAIADLEDAERGELASITAPRRLSPETRYSFANSVTVMYEASKIPNIKSSTKIDTLSNDLLYNFLVLHHTDKSVAGWGEFGWHPDAVVNDFKNDSFDAKYPEPNNQMHDSDNGIDFFRWAWTAYNGFVDTTYKSVWEGSAPKKDDYELAEVTDSDTKAAVASVVAGRWYMNEPRKADEYTATSFIDEESQVAAETFGSPQPITRPNGAQYFPRKLSSSTVHIKNQPKTTYYDVAALQKARDSGVFALLFGPPGTGKTALAEAAFPGIITMEGTADTETSDFVGSYIQTGPDTFEWVDGPLVVAMETGVPLLIDEIALIDTRMMAIVYSVMDGRGEINVTANPRRGVVHATEGFYIVGACNPDVPGAIMSDALLSRFQMQIEVNTDYQMLTKLGVDRRIITVATNLARQVQVGEVMKAPQTRELLAYQKIHDNFGQATALANFIATADDADRKMYEQSVNSTFGVAVGALSL